MKEIDIKGVSRENMTTTSVAYFAREKKVYSQKFREIMWHCSDGHRPTKFTIYKEHKYRAHKGVAPAASLCTAGSNDTCYGCKELKKDKWPKTASSSVLMGASSRHICLPPPPSYAGTALGCRQALCGPAALKTFVP